MKTYAKKSLSILLSLIMLLSCLAGLNFSAYSLSSSGECGDNVTYTFNETTGELIISGTGAMKNYNYDSSPFYNNSSIKSVVFNSGVTSIGDYAFQDCKSLTSVTIPVSVTSIGNVAFYRCESLTNITIPNSVTSIGESAFSVCTSLTSVTIPNSVTSIGSDAFSNCTSLTSVTIPNSVTSIGNYAFSYCSRITSVTIPDSVTSIGDWAFWNCTSLTSVTIPNSVTSIGNRAFSDCTSLTSVNINSIEAWCNISFYNYVSNPLCYAHNLYLNGDLITDLVIPDSVTSIGDYAFSYCESLISVTIPNSVTSIGNGAFRECIRLTSVTIPDSVTSIGENAFFNVLNINHNGTANGSPWGAKAVNGYVDGYFVYRDSTRRELLGCSSQPTSVTIPDSVTSIGNHAFYHCISLTSVTIPNSVISIGENAFRYCISLTSVTIGNSVTSIGYYAFRECTSLTSVTIPNSVTSIGGSAFEYCASLTDIYYIGTEFQWSNISKGNSAIPSKATIHYHTEHTFSIVKEATRIPCARDGYTVYRCECGIKYAEILPMHTPGETVIENRIEPTCTEDGSYDEVVYCSVCNEEINRNSINARKKILVDSSAYPESPHSYTNNMNETYSFSYPGAISLIITFSSSTATESGYDYIYLYNSNGSQIGKYDGTSLAEKTFTIDGNSFSIKLTSDGSQTKYGFSFSSIYAIDCEESLSALGHSFTNYVSDDNYTCTEDGTKTAKCDRCDETNTTTDVGSAGHRYSIISSKAPTCEAKGLTIYQCSECGSKKVETPDALGHKEVNDNNYVAPTCTESGLTESYSCSRCNKIVLQEEIPALGHKEYIIKGYPATCTNAGCTDEIGCSVCGEIFEESVVIKPLGHDLTSKVIAPTCLNEGYTVYSCSRCEYQSRISVKPALGHCFREYEYNNDATCTVDGTKTAKCIRCDETDTLLDLNHLAGHKYEFLDSTATCTEDGFDVYICSECDDIDYIEVKAGHKFVCEVVGGELQYTCSVCGEVENKTAEEIKTLWNDDFANSAPAMGEDSAYLDINNDGVINAKDYVRIMRMK